MGFLIRLMIFSKDLKNNFYEKGKTNNIKILNYGTFRTFKT